MEPQQDSQPQPTPPPAASPPDPNAQQPANNATKPNIVYIGFVLAFVVPLAGLIVSIIARRRVIEKSLPGRGLALAGIIIGGVLTAFGAAFLGFAVWLFAAFGGFHGNGAQSASKPLTAQIEGIGGKRICSNGDSGYGIDNSTPWYDVYYEVPDSSQLTSQIENIASGQGYQLTADQSTINQLKGVPDQYGDVTEPYGGEKFNPRSDYLKGENGDKNLSITINRQTTVSLYCDSGQYGRKQAAGNGMAIVDLSMRLPTTNR